MSPITSTLERRRHVTADPNHLLQTIRRKESAGISLGPFRSLIRIRSLTVIHLAVCLCLYIFVGLRVRHTISSYNDSDIIRQFLREICKKSNLNFCRCQTYDLKLKWMHFVLEMIFFRWDKPFKGQRCQLVAFCHPGLTYVFNFRNSGTLALRSERQSGGMSEIKNVG